jgi:anaerobic selenocysteine-containing dehydrogenase
MDRRNFFKIVSTASAGVVTGACGKKTDALIPLLVPDHQIVPGEEQWHPSVCGECGAACGTIVRVMEGERVVERNGEKLRERIACAKKIEGNPLDPVSGGRLCARGHAALQDLYNPDRLQGPLRRKGERGKADFAPVSWSEAIATAGEKLAKAKASDPAKILFLTSGHPGTRAQTIQRFLDALGAPPPVTCSLSDLALERKAAEVVFGWRGVPVYDLAHARYALGIGADFLGGWASPVYYARQFGQFRQGRPDLRGRLVQAESRMSITASSADQWLPIRPGSESHFTLAVMRVLVEENLGRGRDQLPATALDSVKQADLPKLIRTCGIEERRLRRIAHELGESEAPVVLAGASIVHSNSLEALVASHYLNLLLGNVGLQGGVLPPAPSENAVTRSVLDALDHAQIVLIDGVNPIYTLPAASRIREVLAPKDFIISFGSFLDDTAAYSDLILPDHHVLESTAALVPAVSQHPAVSITTSLIQPLYNTRSVEETLAELAGKTGAAFEPATPKSMIEPMLPEGQTFDEVARQGGLWLDSAPESPAKKPPAEALDCSDPAFAGAADQFPYQFQPYLSLQFHDGSGANLPWMQELPDPVSSAIWGLPVEIDAQTAAKLQIATGDWVSVESAHGKIEAPAYVHPAAIPGVVSMAIGGGHSNYGRYASGRGANPLSILAPAFEKTTNALAFGDTRVRLSRIPQQSAKLIQFSIQDREEGRWAGR